MSMIAAGAYIRTLREARQISRAQLATAAGTHASQIERIEKGEQDTRGSLLVAIVRAVQGSLDQIARLLLDETATAEDGKLLAHEWLSQEVQHEIDRFATSIPNDQIADVIAKIEQLQAEPDAIFRLRGYLERLLEEYIDEQRREQGQSALPPSRRRFPWRRRK